jgi:putative oxidoreductase
LRYLDRLQPLALFVMRLALGAVMIGHGYLKVFGGLHHHAQFVASLGLPAWTAYLSAFTELFGGLLILLGLSLASPHLPFLLICPSPWPKCTSTKV